MVPRVLLLVVLATRKSTFRIVAFAMADANVNPNLVAAMSLIEQLRSENSKLVNMWEQVKPSYPL